MVAAVGAPSFDFYNVFRLHRQHDLEDTFRTGEILAHDPDDLVHEAVVGWIREAG
jgi:DNA alkylation repair enzyme